MKYNASVSDFFKSPKWGMNILLGAITILIPIIGQLVLTGWHITGFWGRRDGDDDPAKFPPFDFQFFVPYLERGLWPFLVQLVSSFIMMPVMLVMVIPLLLLPDARNAHHDLTSSTIFGVVFIGAFCLQALLMTIYSFVIIPLVLRATILQDFAKAFDFRFVKNFLARVWPEMLASLIFMFSLSLCLMVFAVITCYIGALFAAPVVIYSWHHLQQQLYQVYLSRGGEPLPLSPKLQALPPLMTAG